jgi:DNA polymerase-1
MNYLHFCDRGVKASYPVCLLVPYIQRDDIQREYLDPYKDISPEDVLVISLHYGLAKKTPKAEMVMYIEQELAPVLKDMNVQYVLCADGEYFKALTGATKVDTNVGYVLNSKYGDWKVIYVPNPRMIFHDPIKVRAKIKAGMDALIQHAQDAYVPPGQSIIEFEEYPDTVTEIGKWLAKLLEMRRPLTIDIETFSLKHYSAGIGTIAFAWSKNEGIAFKVDLGDDYHRAAVRMMLKDFFMRYSNTSIYHNIAFDAYVLIYQLFMKDLLDTQGLLEGMDHVLRSWDCTKLISYLATNSCAGNKLSLKEQAQEFAGNYAVGEDIKDIRKVPLDKLLRYNLVDALSTWHVYEKNMPNMIEDMQQPIYVDIFKPSTHDIIQMQLTGMPINMRRTREARWLLYRERRDALRKIKSSKIVQEFTYYLNEEWVRAKNEKLKVKRVTMSDAKEVYNPDSDPQTRAILYDMLGLPELDFTDSRLPATGGKTLAKLVNHTKEPEVIAFLEAMMAYGTVSKLLSSFIPAMLNAQKGPDGHYYLFGNFNLGGTLSGRLSSSGPNLQNLPAGSEGESTLKGRLGKIIKSCFEAPTGWLFVGLDFASLEDRISALTTKDPNKLKVYTDGYDGHSLRAFAYYGDQMPDISGDTVDSINSIAVKYKPLRDKSKNPTFTLTYQGTYKTLMTKYGFAEELAKIVEAKYHELYKVSDEWVSKKLDEASKTGYITAAFGLRVRTPLLKQVIRGNKGTPPEAEAEGRSAGNALGQSWCLLNSRACNEFMAKVRKSEHRLDIKPCAQIHDAQYYLIRDDIALVEYANDNLVQAVKWQDHPDIMHPEVGLGGEIDIFYPNWSKGVTIPNGATREEIINKIDEHVAKLAA